MKSTNSITFVVGLSTLILCACSGGSGTGLLPDSDQADAASGATKREDSSDDASATSNNSEDSTDARVAKPGSTSVTTSNGEKTPDSGTAEPVDAATEAAASENDLPPSEQDAADTSPGDRPPPDPDDVEELISRNNGDSSEAGTVDPVAGLSPEALIEQSVFRIEATGTFVTPLSDDAISVAGGTGFVIDDKGYALTNAHVVSGATLLRVTFPKEDRDRNAQVVARAECSDIALLKLDGNEGAFPYLDWSGQAAALGTDILALGYPLGGDLTLTNGIVSKESTSAHTSWASVDDVIEHTATINPGSSGGPLLSEDYEVMGINYAATSLNQYYAISEHEAIHILQQLREGKDVYSIGVTGTAVGDAELSGIWVYAVQAGSPADSAGIQPGDLITHLGNLPLVPNATGAMTMENYCDILRSHAEGAAIDVKLLRWSNGELWEGQVNGRALQRIEEVIEPEPAPDTTVLVTHTLGSISVEAPISWIDAVSYTHTRYDDAEGHALVVAPDADAFRSQYDRPGLLLAAWTDTAESPDHILDNYSFEADCDTTSERTRISLKGYTGVYELYAGCPGDETIITQMVLSADDHTLRLLYQAITDDEIAALDLVLDSMTVEPTLLP